MCSALLRNSACVNAATRSGHVTPLQRAAYCGHSDVVSLLLRSGAEVQAQDSDKKTALHKVGYSTVNTKCLVKQQIKIISQKKDESIMIFLVRDYMFTEKRFADICQLYMSHLCFYFVGL